jgi:tetratricopeptide (TPR) repeat protein
LLITASVTISFGGCTHVPSSTSPAKSRTASSSSVGTKANGAAANADVRCQTLLASGLEMMKPANMEISAEAKSAVLALNNWVRDCGKTGGGADSTLDPRAATLLPENERATAKSELYELPDVEHVRNCLLLRQAGARIAHSFKSDLERTVGLFDYVNRLIANDAAADEHVPATLYDVLVLGRGSAEDRTWVFAELLRQIGLDTVVLTPVPRAGTNSAAPSRWLVGVLIEKQTYLFDPLLGWPIPSDKDKGDAPTIRIPATLAEVVGNDALLRRLDLSVEKPYPLHANDLKSLRVEIVTSGRYWLPRLQRLESFFSGDRAATIYTALSDIGKQRGIFTRVSEAGGSFWNKDAVSVWRYPDQQSSAADRIGSKAAERRAMAWLPLEGPVKVSFDVNSLQPVVEPTNHLELKARVAELQADYTGAIRSFLLVQLEELPPALPLPSEARDAVAGRQKPGQPAPTAYQIPPQAYLLNLRAAENAKFWMGLCQMELGQFTTAAETFSAYIRRSDQSEGNAWLPQAVYLHALTMANTKQFALAVQLINQLVRALPEDNPRRYGYELLANRWRAARDASTNASWSKPAASKTEQKNAPAGAPAVGPAKP